MPAPIAIPSRPLVCAIPVRDEADRIGLCLRALAGQKGRGLDHVVLLLNNCTDDTAARARAEPVPFSLCIVERLYAPPFAHAGTARREALEIAASLAGPDGILFTTDADGMVRPDWLAANLAALAAGADVVCGRAEIDPVEAQAIPAHLHDDDAREVAYGTLLDRIHDLVDPDPNDPWPRHTEHSGASIAVTVAAWRMTGGVPALRSGEDRGFLEALRRADRAIRHAPDAIVTVSGRTVGRAPGGMAETMARRIRCQDEMLDDSLEPATLCLARATARADLRRLRGKGPIQPDAAARYAAGLGLPLPVLMEWVAERHFGLAWAQIEAASPLLRRVAVPRADLSCHHAQAERILRDLDRATPGPGTVAMIAPLIDGAVG